jgi:hypothetical protein
MLELYCLDEICNVKISLVESISFFDNGFSGYIYNIPFLSHRVKDAIYEKNDFEVMDFLGMEGGVPIISINCTDSILKFKYSALKHMPLFNEPGPYTILFTSWELYEALNGRGERKINDVLGLPCIYKKITCTDGIVKVKKERYKILLHNILDDIDNHYFNLDWQAKYRYKHETLSSNNNYYDGTILQLLTKLDSINSNLKI